MTSWHWAQRWGPSQAVCGQRWAPAAPYPAQQAVACQGTWGPWCSLRRGKVVPRGRAQGRDLPGWMGPDRAWDCWHSTPGCWLIRVPGQGYCSWHWGLHHSGGAEGSYLEGKRNVCSNRFTFINVFFIRGHREYLEVRTGRMSRPADRSRGAWAPPVLSEGTWVVPTAGGQTEAPGCYAAWREGNLKKQTHGRA